MLKTIIEVTNKLEENNIDYFLTGGTSLFLRKIIKETKDIDISIKEKNVTKVKEIFKDEKVFISNKKIITFYKDGFEVELLITSEKSNFSANNILENKLYEKIKIQGKEINLISLKDLLSMYRFVYLRDGKEKHLERIKLLEKLIKT